MSKIKKILIVLVVIILIFISAQIINAGKYKMIVNVVDGENVMGVNPTTEKLDFGDLSRNNGMTRYITLRNGGSMPVYVAIIKFGKISDLVDINKNYFTLDPQKEAELAFDIKIPPSAEMKKYSGWVIVFRLPKIW